MHSCSGTEGCTSTSLVTVQFATLLHWCITNSTIPGVPSAWMLAWVILLTPVPRACGSPAVVQPYAPAARPPSLAVLQLAKPSDAATHQRACVKLPTNADVAARRCFSCNGRVMAAELPVSVFVLSSFAPRGYYIQRIQFGAA